MTGTPCTPSLLRAPQIGARRLPLPVDHYEVAHHGALATVFEVTTNEVVYQGPGPAEVIGVDLPRAPLPAPHPVATPPVA